MFRFQFIKHKPYKKSIELVGDTIRHYDYKKGYAYIQSHYDIRTHYRWAKGMKFC
jgi:hypothetical protein